jgi:hypothetical protein
MLPAFGWPTYLRVNLLPLPGDDRNHILNGRSAAILRPCFHKLAPLFQKICTPISALDSIADTVRKALFRELSRDACALRTPIPET